MKPIFEEERQFINEKFGIELPKDCWRKGSAIYLDMFQKKPLYRFRVKDTETTITQDNTKLFKDNGKSLEEVLIAERNRTDKLFDSSVDFTREYILSNPQAELYTIGYSSGKDSILVLTVWLEALKKYPELIDFMEENNIKWEVLVHNTSNDTAETYRNIKNTLPRYLNKYGYDVNFCGYSDKELIYQKMITSENENSEIAKVTLINPSVGFYIWLKEEKDYLIPTVLRRNCCSVYKEGKANEFYDTKANIISVSGVRKFESHKRAKYEEVMDFEFKKKLFGRSNSPKSWVQVAPIVNWKNEDVWIYILNNDIPLNPMYKLGFHRVGCLICPFQQSYIDEIIKEHYPKQWSRWTNILTKAYDIYDVEDRLNWTLEEYINGEWKFGTSKVYKLTRLIPKPERVTEVANLMGLSEDMARKYFKRTCKVCGKNLNPNEIGMFFKLNGRYDGLDDTRELLCKKHIRESQNLSNKEYTKLFKEYANSGCELF